MCVEEAVTVVESMLTYTPPHTHYKGEVDSNEGLVQEYNQPTPSHATLEHVMVEGEALYRLVTPPFGDIIPVEVEHFPVDDCI